MMGQFSVAAATAVVNYDLAQNTLWGQSGARRWLNSVGVTGSAAALDTLVRVYAGARWLGDVYNSATGSVQRNSSMFRIGSWVQANEEVHVLVVDAPATNPINGVLDFAD